VFFGIQDDGKSPEKFCEFCIIVLDRTEINPPDIQKILLNFCG
jgi:hypothetical protein